MLDTLRRPVSWLVGSLPAPDSITVPDVFPLPDIRDGIAAVYAYLRREPQPAIDTGFPNPGPVTRRLTHNLYRC